MADEGQLSRIARERAGKLMDAAVGALNEAADRIAEEHQIPHGINGLTRGEILGRTAFVASMQRELRVAAEMQLATEIMKAETYQPQYDPQKLKGPEVTLIKPLGGNILPPLVAPPPATKAPANDTIDLGELPGITVSTVKALKAAGFHRVCDVRDVPDEHLLAVNGIATKSLGALRAAVSAYLK